MAVYERSSLVRAPFDEVWRFHASIDGLEAVTPGWFNLRVESVVAPNNVSDELVEDSEVTLSIRPFGVGPRLSWTSRVVRRDRNDRQGVLVDAMHDGPFPRWHHTHQLVATDDGTRLTDRVEYTLPLGRASVLSGFAWPGFAAVFALRHRETRRQLE